MDNHRFPHSDAPLRRVKSLQFGVWSPEDIKAYSVTQLRYVNGERIPVGITRSDASNPLTGEPVYGGVNDPRMGTNDPRHPEEPGFFGHIELAAPVYHVGFMNVVLAVLRCVSFHSSRIVLSELDVSKSAQLRNAQQLRGKHRLSAMLKLCQNKRKCPQTGGPQPKYKKEGLKIWAEFPTGSRIEGQDIAHTGKTLLRPSEAYDVLKRIPDSDCEMLGLDPKFARPEWFLVTVLPVPPVHVRPSIAMNSTQRCEDDLTHKLSSIVKANIAVRAVVERGEPEHVVDVLVDLLQYHVATFVDNQLPNQKQDKQKSGKLLKTLRQRLVGKEGRVRGNLMGKRVDFSARTVITADPNLSIDQVGVPRSIARNLTVPERVNAHNIEKCRRWIRNGPFVHPGAKFVVKEDGTMLDLRYVNSSDVQLEFGSIVERHLDNDDVVLFNRQPSLHKMSIMGHRVRVLDYSTFRLNLSVTSPYNADFDGDEMNLHVPQGIAARTEIEEFMMVNKVIVSAQANRPVMGIVQDSLLASAMMTTRGVFLSKALTYNLLMWIDDWNGEVPTPSLLIPDKEKVGSYTPLWTGKQLFSEIVPEAINLTRTSKGHPDGERFPYDLSPNDTYVLIERGRIISGVIDKKTLGATGGGLVHVVFNELGPERARILLNQVQKLSNYWILQHSYTVGLGDAVADDATLREVETILQDAKEGVSKLVKEAQRGELDVQPGRTMVESFEDYVNMKLNSARDDSGKKAEQSLTVKNAFKGTVHAGSKGSFINISQIMACVAGDSFVTLADGTGVAVSELRGDSTTEIVGDDHVASVARPVLGYFSRDGERDGKAQAPQAAPTLFNTETSAWIERGFARSDCLEITVRDGSSLVCTPDHLLLDDDSSWVRADSLVPGKKLRVSNLCGASVSEGPVDYEGVFVPTLGGAIGLTRSEALCRLVGLLLTDGHLTEVGGGLFFVDTEFAVDAVKRDVLLLAPSTSLNLTYACRRDDQHGTWNLGFDTSLGDVFRSLGCSSGNKIQNGSSLPAFLQSADLPDALAREFLAAYFGGDGPSPTVDKRGTPNPRKKLLMSARLFEVGRGWQMAPFHNLTASANRVAALLERFGVNVDVVTTFNYQADPRAPVKVARPIGAAPSPDENQWSLCASSTEAILDVLKRLPNGSSRSLRELWNALRAEDAPGFYPTFSLESAVWRDVQDLRRKGLVEVVAAASENAEEEEEDDVATSDTHCNICGRNLVSASRVVRWDEQTVLCRQCASAKVGNARVRATPQGAASAPFVPLTCSPRYISARIGVQFVTVSDASRFADRITIRYSLNKSLRWSCWKRFRDYRALCARAAFLVLNIASDLLFGDQEDPRVWRESLSDEEVPWSDGLEAAVTTNLQYRGKMSPKRCYEAAVAAFRAGYPELSAKVLPKDYKFAGNSFAINYASGKQVAPRSPDDFESSLKLPMSYKEFCASGGAPEISTPRASLKNVNRYLNLDVVRVRPVTQEIRVYDLTVPSGNAFVANGFIVHNCVGQQNVEGQRIPYGFEQRTLPHFTKDDLGPESRGFVENSYLKGLTPQEFFFHAMGGREGLIDTACKTAETGYIQRRLVKALEDVSVRYDGTVRNGRNDVIQFLYGEDGMDGVRVETQYFDVLGKADDAMAAEFDFLEPDCMSGLFRGRPFVERSVVSRLKRDASARDVLRNEFERLLDSRDTLTQVMYYREPGGARHSDSSLPFPINLKRLIWNAQKAYNIDSRNGVSDLDPVDVVESVDALLSELIVVHSEGKEDVLGLEAQENATLLLRINIRTELSAKRVVRKHRLSREAFEALLSTIRSRFNQALVQPGEMCGVVAAQSIGEPATQMTLNTFHYAGVSAKNVTLGVPRLKEIINVSRNVKTPSVTVYLDDETAVDKDKADDVLNGLEFATLKDVTLESSLWFDPLTNIDPVSGTPTTCVEEDKEFVDPYYELPDEDLDLSELSPWVLRFVLDSAVMDFKRVSLKDLVLQIASLFGDRLRCVVSDENAEKRVLRVRHVNVEDEPVSSGRDLGESTAEKETDEAEEAEELRNRLKAMKAGLDVGDNDDNASDDVDVDFLRGVERALLNELVLKGVSNIKKMFIREEKRQVWTQKSGFQSRPEWVLDTEGTNLREILQFPGVDHTRTVSNDIVEILDVLGIEATRRALLNELRAVISFDDSYVNYRHLSILVDAMTYRGFLMAITRHGINRVDSGPLLRASFEETVEILMEAAAFGENDSMAGVTENVMMGQMAPVGTGCFDLFLDEDALKDAVEIEEFEPHENGFDGSVETAMSDFTPMVENEEFSPLSGSGDDDEFSPMSSEDSGEFSPMEGGGGDDEFSPMASERAVPTKTTTDGGDFGGASSPLYSPEEFSPASPAYSVSSPLNADEATSPAMEDDEFSPSSPLYGGGELSPSSPMYGAASSSDQASPSSPSYSPSSPLVGSGGAGSPASPAEGYSPSSPSYSPSSPAYTGGGGNAASPSSPAYSPSSPAMGGGGDDAGYSPSSPAYSPSSPAMGGGDDDDAGYSPSSPAYSPSSPAYSPSSPAYEG